MTQRSYLLLLLLTFISPIFAQHEFGMHFLRNNWHANETNPAIIRDSSGVFRLPSVYNGLFIEGPSYRQLVSKQNGEPVINVNSAINFLDAQNVIADDFELQTFGFAIPVKNKLVLSFGHAIKYFAFFKYPKELAQVVWQGNAQFIGETVDIGNELQVTGFHSLDLGGIYKVNENLRIGAKAKYMSGFVDITTDANHKSINLYTDPDIYEITLQGDYVLNSSNALEYNSYDDFDADLNFGTFTTNNFFGGNNGVAFDLGIYYKKDNWDLAASVLNLGSGITWTKELANYAIQDSYEYNGLDFSNAIIGGDTPSLDASLDSLEQIFQPVESSTEYTNNIPRRVYLSGLYKYNEKLDIGAAFFSQHFRGETTNAFGLHFNYDLLKWLNLGMTYSANGRTNDNLGGTLMVQGRSWQLFALTDNLVDLIDPTNGNDFGIRLGGNIYF